MAIGVLGLVGRSDCLNLLLNLVGVGEGVGLAGQDCLDLDPQGEVLIGAGLKDVADAQEGDAVVLGGDLAAHRTGQTDAGSGGAAEG